MIFLFLPDFFSFIIYLPNNQLWDIFTKTTFQFSKFQFYLKFFIYIPTSYIAGNNLLIFCGNFMSVFMRDICVQFSCSGFVGIRVIFASSNELVSTPSYFPEEFVRNWILSFLDVWQNILVKQSGARFFFVRSNVATSSLFLIFI